MRRTSLSLGVGAVLAVGAACAHEPAPSTPLPVASSGPAAASSPPAPIAVLDAATVDAAPDAAVDPCEASFAKRLADAQEAIEDTAEERARGKARCALLKKKCVARRGGMAADCNGTSREDHDFFEDTCLRWSGVRWYDGSVTYVAHGVRKDCNDAVPLTIEESTWDDDVARIRGTRP
jgi:hypothetical protein